VKEASGDFKVERVHESVKVPTFHFQELELGKLLGTGGFSNVFELRAIDITSEYKTENDGVVQNKTEGRVFMSSHCLRADSGDARYAVKLLRDEVVDDFRMYKVGAADLAVEVEFLSKLVHPNIIKLRGVSASGLDGFDSLSKGGYFLVLDRLYDTLAVKRIKWQKEYKHHKGIFGRIKSPSGKALREFFACRLKAAFDLAAAMKFLHDRKIIFRDLKAENVGFDIRGDVKLFDFGLVRKLDPATALTNGTYKLSGNTGTRRYMAPEVARYRPYNLSADVYSYSILLWEICKLKQAFEGYTFERHYTEVLVNGERPLCGKNNWPPALIQLINRGWAEKFSERPSFDEFVNTLKEIVAEFRGGDETGLEHSKRRSTFS